MGLSLFGVNGEMYSIPHRSRISNYFPSGYPPPTDISELERVISNSTYQDGHGYLAGSFPDGITSVEGVPASATIRVLLRLPGYPADGEVVAEVQSNPDGTWLVEGLNHNLKYDVICRHEGYNDMILSNVSPALATGLEFAGSFTTLDDQVEILLGTGPYQIDVVDGTPPIGVTFKAVGDYVVATGDPAIGGEFFYTLRVIDSTGLSGVFESTTNVAYDPHWDNVVGLYRAIEGQIVDISNFGGVFTSNTGLNIDSSEETPDDLPALKLSANKTAVVTTEELGTDDFTIEMWVKAKGSHPNWPRIWATRNVQNVADGFHSSQYSGNGLEIMSYVGGLRGGEGPAPYGAFHHIALVRESGVYRNYLNGSDVTGVPRDSQNDTNGVFVFGQGGASQIDLWFSGVRITKGVARYTEDFDPPTEPFLNRGL